MLFEFYFIVLYRYALLYMDHHTEVLEMEPLLQDLKKLKDRAGYTSIKASGPSFRSYQQDYKLFRFNSLGKKTIASNTF